MKQILNFTIIEAVDNLKPVKPQYNNKKYNFWNPSGSPIQNVSWLNKLRYLFCCLHKVLFDKYSSNNAHVLNSEAAINQLYELENNDSITWLGHSCFLIKIGGIKILTDPSLDRRASFSQLLGPKRSCKPPLELTDLPEIDVILITHNHYDHFCRSTMRKMPNIKQIHVFAPINLKHEIISLGYKHVYELNWMDKASSLNLQIQSLPAIHWSRSLFSSINNSLWCGYGIYAGGKSIYFAGDTAYGDVFQKIVKLCQPFDIAIVPIGGYDPPEIMAAHHVNPEEAVKISAELCAKKIIAMHWGTFSLSLEEIFEPVQRFNFAARNAEYNREDIWVMNIGESRKL